MKKTLIALASFAALSAAHADVTLYGVIDASLVTTSAGSGSSDVNNPANINVLNSYGRANVGATSQGGSITANGRTTSMGNGVLQPSRWGIKGSEDLGSGMKANFVLESGLNIAGGNNPNDHQLLATNAANTGYGDSSLNGQMFDRQASVGLSGDFGSIDAGFQLNLNGELNGMNDPLGAGYISPLGFYGGLTGMGSSYSGRASNSFKYAYSLGTTTLKAFYAIGGLNGNAGQGSQTGIAAMIKLTPTLDVNIGDSRMNDNVSFGPSSTSGVATAATANAGTDATVAAGAVVSGTALALSASYFNSTQTTLGVVYQATPTLKLKGGYITITQSNPSNAAADATITQNIGVPINTNAINTQPYATNYGRSIYWIGGTYDLTPQSHISVGYYSLTLGAYTANAFGVNNASPITQAYSSNTLSTFAGVFDYDLSKKTDIYVAGAYQAWNSNGALANSTVTATSTGSNTVAANQTTSAGTNQTTFAIGLRVKF